MSLALGLGLCIASANPPDVSSGGALVNPAQTLSGSGNTFSPISLSPLVWVRSDLGVTTGGGGTTVTTWADQSGNGNDYTVGALNAPGYTASQYNGHPGINGVDGTRGLSSSVAGPGTSSTWVIVFKKSSSNSLFYMFADTGGANGMLVTGPVNPATWFNGADNYSFGAISSGLHQIIVTQVDGSSLIGYLDGVQVFSHTPAVTANFAPKYLFGYGAGASGTNGDIVEFMLTGAAANTTQVAQLHLYSQLFWGTP